MERKEKLATRQHTLPLSNLLRPAQDDCGTIPGTGSTYWFCIGINNQRTTSQWIDGAWWDNPLEDTPDSTGLKPLIRKWYNRLLYGEHPGGLALTNYCTRP